MYWAVEKNHNDIGKAILENDPTLEIQTKVSNILVQTKTGLRLRNDLFTPII